MNFDNINIKEWNRKEIFEFYKDYEQPFFNLTANVDVTELYSFCKKNNYSFFLTCLYISTKVANSIYEFRIRIEGGKPIVFNKINTGTTILKENNTFCFSYLEFFENFKTYINNCENKIQEDITNKFNEGGSGDQGVLYHSAVPWVSFTSVQHAQDSAKGRTVPKIVFGKYFKVSEKLLMPLSVEVHHALADGYHVGLYYERFQKEILNLS